MLTQAPKGTQDVLPQQSYRWQAVEKVMRDTAALYGYREIRTPIFEHTELFQRGVGGTTDVVQKEMYTFTDKGDRSITLKPEGTAGAARAFIEAHRDEITIHLGLEAEYYPRYEDHLRRMRERGIGYYLLGQHAIDSEEDSPWTSQACEADDDMVRRYADTVARALGTGLFAYVAHPDIYLRRRPAERFNRACEEAADIICQSALEAGVPVEYNLLGLDCRHRGEVNCYPADAFWQYIAKWRVPAIIGVDAHQPALLLNQALWDEGMAALTGLGFTVLDRLPMDAAQA